MYIRRKVFSHIQNEDGEVKLFSTTDYEMNDSKEVIRMFAEKQEREFSAHKRKQNRRIAAAQHNAEMHANKAAKKANKAIVEAANGNLEKAEILNKSAERLNRAAQIDSTRVADEITKASRQRKSIVTNPEGLAISNQGAGNMIVNSKDGVVSTTRVTPEQSGAIKVSTKTKSTGGIGSKAKAPEVIIETPKGKEINTESLRRKIKTNEKMIKAGKFLEKNKKPLMVAAAATTAATLGGVAYKKYKDNKNKK